jgi:ATP-dependent Zn protease
VDLANLVNEAALLATRRGGENVTLDDFTQAVERIVAGLEKRNRILSAHEREVVAHHEMGHARVAMVLPGLDPVQKVSIIPRGIAALGYTIQRPLEDRFLMDRTELLNRMTVLLGGRAAETLMFDDISTGAGDDRRRRPRSPAAWSFVSAWIRISARWRMSPRRRSCWTCRCTVTGSPGAMARRPPAPSMPRYGH